MQRCALHTKTDNEYTLCDTQGLKIEMCGWPSIFCDKGLIY